MVRLEDTIRVPPPYHGNTEEDTGSRGTPEPNVPPHPSTNDGRPINESETSQGNGHMGESGNKTSGNARPHLDPKLISEEETTEIARRAVEKEIQETKRPLAENEVVSDVVKPKLTIDLGHSNIVRIPESVVDIIKDEVERLSLSNNYIFHIPFRFSECSHLRYLNIRANNLREFPIGVYKLPLLEILDISRNKISHLPEEIKELTSLRVLSVMQNCLEDLPLGLSEMSKLETLKVARNPLKAPLQQALEDLESVIEPSISDNEKEVAVTAGLKRFLKTQHLA